MSSTITTNPNRYSERVTSYTLNGAIRRLQRHGLKDNGVYGKIDNLNITLEGNRVVAVTDDAAPLLRAGSTDFADGSDTTAEYTYNGVGALTSDANRGITLIEYDNLNHPRRVSFRDGHTVEWVYAPDGTRLRAIHTTAVEGVSVAPGMRSEPDAAHIVRRDTTDYSAGVTWGPGNRLERVEIPGGYATIGAGGVPRYHYYTADHVGNNRVVVSEDGVIEQVVHYYPFGGQYADAGLNLSAQQYKHGGKELDPAYGLDWHDFGARPYYAPLAAWSHVDRYAEKYYQLSPYCYCANNPIANVDVNGDSIAILVVGGNIGHLAMLIQGDDGKWNYYSMNGNTIYRCGGSSGGKGYHDKGEKEFDSVDAFLNSEYNREGYIWEANRNLVTNYDYERAFVIPTTNEQDATAILSFEKYQEEGYNLYDNQCAQVVQKVLKDIGVKVSIDGRFKYLPNKAYKQIKSVNRNGHEYIKKPAEKNNRKRPKK